jgi:hypothetical protein
VAHPYVKGFMRGLARAAHITRPATIAMESATAATQSDTALLGALTVFSAAVVAPVAGLLGGTELISRSLSLRALSPEYPSVRVVQIGVSPSVFSVIVIIPHLLVDAY